MRHLRGDTDAPQRPPLKLGRIEDVSYVSFTLDTHAQISVERSEVMCCRSAFIDLFKDIKHISLLACFFFTEAIKVCCISMHVNLLEIHGIAK